MKSLVITDKDLATDLFKKSVIVNLNNLRYSFCTGGLECLKNEGQCYFYDDMSTLSSWINDSSLIIMITRTIYGGMDVPLKKMFERMIVNSEPYYTIEDGKTCHLNLSASKKRLLIIAYGDTSKEDQALFKGYFDTVKLGYNITLSHYFCKEEELNDILKAFGGVDDE
ncbi:flavodoxin family protein [Eggerthia catenaformis]|uniref:flavodoxin family protein n=1 Tax=Eggerthia catenaformis TaxID=31973 RepID=UPI003C6FFD28